VPVKKHVPLRTCVICGKKAAKRELLRIVASPTGEVAVDESGKAAGRGAYVCADGRCVGNRLHRGRLEHVLRTQLKGDAWEAITTRIASLATVAGKVDND
jgi:hypothetical protein